MNEGQSAQKAPNYIFLRLEALLIYPSPENYEPNMKYEAGQSFVLPVCLNVRNLEMNTANYSANYLFSFLWQLLCFCKEYLLDSARTKFDKKLLLFFCFFVRWRQ